MNPIEPDLSHAGSGAIPKLFLKTLGFGLLLLVVVPSVALVGHLRSMSEERSLISKINAIPLRPEASCVGNSGPLRVVFFPDRPARLVGVENFKRSLGETGTWLDDQFDGLALGVPYAARLSYTSATDDDLERVAVASSLQFVTLESTHITDAGLGHLRRLPRLVHLSVADTAVTDQGVETIAGMRSLSFLNLRGTRVTNRGLAKLIELASLQTLNIADTAIVGEGVAFLATIGELTGLNLSGLRIGDDDIGNLCLIRSLQRLDLSRTEITDCGLVRLAGLDSLRELRVADTRVTEEGLDRLRRAAPIVDVISGADLSSLPIDW